MTLFKKGTGVLLLSGLLPGFAFAQDPSEPPLQDITSTIAVSNVDGFTVSQQIGAPLSLPTMTEGSDDVLYQGLFSALTGVSSANSAIEGIFADNASFAIAFDPSIKTLKITLPQSESATLFVVNMAGKTVISREITGPDTSISVNSLAPGVYMAGAASSNKFSKTLKFIVK